jgi:hypothetical protein
VCSESDCGLLDLWVFGGTCYFHFKTTETSISAYKTAGYHKRITIRTFNACDLLQKLSGLFLTASMCTESACHISV